MVTDFKDNDQTLPEEETPQEREEFSLPASFYENLINQPLCKRTGKCNGCGQCEH